MKPITKELLQKAQVDRAALGLEDDAGLVLDLYGSTTDVGTDAWGIPMTANELQQAESKMDGQVDIVRQTPELETIPGFAGAYFAKGDPTDLLVLSTLPSKAAAALSGSPARVLSASVGFSELQSTAGKLLAHLGPLGADAVGIKLEGGPIFVAVVKPGTDLTAASDLARTITGREVQVVEKPASTDSVCSSRDACYTPMRAGNRIRKGSADSTSYCTQGFIVSVGTDEQLLTAGHCGYSGSNSWYHQQWGYLGEETATFYPASRWDIMRVQLVDSQISKYIYGKSGTVSGMATPIENQSVCASLGASNTLPCGTVTWSSVAWNSNTCGCQVQGGASTISSIGGDSGSPVFSGASSYIAIGLQAQSGGYFSVVSWAVNAWNASIY